MRGLTSSTLVVQSPGASAAARGCIAGFQVIGELEPSSHRYMVVDLAGGREASGYPVTWLDEVPPVGWHDEYRTTKLAFRRIDPGVFQMGSPEDEAGREVDEARHEVTLTKPYYIGIFETTQKQWERVQGNNPASLKGDMRPVDQVSYEDIRGASAGAGWPASPAVDADSFLGRLRSKTGLACLDLPTEAEWEYACRAGTTGPYNVDGKALDELGRYEGNWSDNRGGYAEYHTAVGWYAPNAWGLWDMHGNVGEWCIDWTASFGGAPETDPVGSWSGKLHTVRGGGWSSTMKNCRSAYRLYQNPNTRSDTIGFRTAVRPRRLTVTSERGNPSPGAGEHLVFDGTVTASVESPLRAGNGTYWVCTGWTGTGSVPATGTNTNVTFTIAEDSSITWNWTPPSRRLKVSVADGGSADFSEGWSEDGKTITVNVTRPAPGDELLVMGDAEGVRYIGDYAFTGSSLATISLPEGIETIGYRAFHTTPWFYAQPDDALMLLWLGEARERSFVYGWKGSFAAGTTLELPPGVSGIADKAFSRQTGLAAVSFPTGLVTIGVSAFSGCSGLTSLVLPEGLKTLWFGAFERCRGLTSVSLPEGVTLQDYAFDECSSLASVSLPDSTRSIGSHVFRGTRLLADQPDGLLRVGNFVCGWKGTMAEGTDVVIPAGTKGIADETFSQCGAMASVVLPEGLEWIGISAFGKCMGLTSLSLPTTLRRIDPMAFMSCSHLTGNVTIPSGVKEIADGRLHQLLFADERRHPRERHENRIAGVRGHGAEDGRPARRPQEDRDERLRQLRAGLRDDPRGCRLHRSRRLLQLHEADGHRLPRDEGPVDRHPEGRELEDGRSGDRRPLQRRRCRPLEPTWPERSIEGGAGFRAPFFSGERARPRSKGSSGPAKP